MLLRTKFVVKVSFFNLLVVFMGKTFGIKHQGKNIVKAVSHSKYLKQKLLIQLQTDQMSFPFYCNLLLNESKNYLLFKNKLCSFQTFV